MLNELTTDLRRLMNDWMSAKPGRNASALRKRCGVSQSTIREILLGERNTTIDRALTIIPAIVDDVGELEFLRKHVPAFERHFNKAGINLGEDTSQSLALRQAITDEQSFVITTLAAARGTTEEEIENIFNGLGLVKLNNLIQSGILKRDGDIIKSEKSILLTYDAETALIIMNHFINLFDRSGIGESGRLCWIRTDSATKEDIGKIHEIFREAYNEASKIARKSEGDEVFYSGIIMSVLDNKEV